MLNDNPVTLFASDLDGALAPAADNPMVGGVRSTIELDAVTRRSASVCGFRIEEKPDTIAIRWAGVPYLHDRHPVVDRFRSWAQLNDLEIIEGGESVEARRRAIGTEAALRSVRLFPDHVVSPTEPKARG